MAIRYSFWNMAKSYAPAQIAGSSGTINANFPLANVQTPERPFAPMKVNGPIGGTSQFGLTFDLGASRAIDMVALINTNVRNWAVVLSDVPYGGSDPTAFSAWVPCLPNPYNGRAVGLARMTPGFTKRYVNILIDDAHALPTYDAAASYSLGGVHVGAWWNAPRDIAWNYKARIVQPRADVQPEHDGWRQRMILGEPYTHLQMHRLAFRNTNPPAMDDHLHDWLAHELEWERWDYALVNLREDSPQLTWIMRRLTMPEWDVDQAFPESDWELEEVIR